MVLGDFFVLFCFLFFFFPLRRAIALNADKET